VGQLRTAIALSPAPRTGDLAIAGNQRPGQCYANVDVLPFECSESVTVFTSGGIRGMLSGIGNLSRQVIEGMAMVSERDIQSRLSDTDARLSAILSEIRPLQRQVSLGEDGWQQALSALADCYSRRRELEVYRESLSWVLS
jgi:hypothetical protein